MLAVKNKTASYKLCPAKVWPNESRIRMKQSSALTYSAAAK